MKYLYLISVLLILIILIVYYNLYYKFKRYHYNDTCYINQNKYKYLKNFDVDNYPINPINPLFQTYYDKSKIPSDIFTNIKKYAPEYTHIIMDDDDIKNFLKRYYDEDVLYTFNSLKNGAHKADLARYCILYIYGGLYMDIKVELIKPLSEIFNKGNNVFYSVISNFGDHIHQAIIKTPARNPLFLSLIDYIVNKKNPFMYIDFCRDMYIQIKNDIGNVKEGFNIGKEGNEYYFFREKCSLTDDSMCYDGFDRYGLCCFVWDGDIPVIKSRRSSYPWK
jgi:hypothetical protein